MMPELNRRVGAVILVTARGRTGQGCPGVHRYRGAVMVAASNSALHSFISAACAPARRHQNAPNGLGLHSTPIRDGNRRPASAQSSAPAIPREAPIRRRQPGRKGHPSGVLIFFMGLSGDLERCSWVDEVLHLDGIGKTKASPLPAAMMRPPSCSLVPECAIAACVSAACEVILLRYRSAAYSASQLTQRLSGAQSLPTAPGCTEVTRLQLAPSSRS